MTLIKCDQAYNNISLILYKQDMYHRS